MTLTYAFPEVIFEYQGRSISFGHSAVRGSGAPEGRILILNDESESVIFFKDFDQISHDDRVRAPQTARYVSKRLGVKAGPEWALVECRQSSRSASTVRE